MDIPTIIGIEDIVPIITIGGTILDTITVHELTTITTDRIGLIITAGRMMGSTTMDRDLVLGLISERPPLSH